MHREQGRSSAEGQTKENGHGVQDAPGSSCLDQCRKMGFDELAGYITDCLERMHDPDPGGDRPRSQEEFRIVWRLLREKHETMPPDPPPPVDPLEAAYCKRDRTLKHLDNAPGNPKIKKRDVKQMRRTLEGLDREIEEMEESGEYEHLPAPAPDTPKQASKRTLSKLLGDIERAFQPRPTGRFQWRPLPPDEASPQKVRGHYRERLHHEGRLDKFDQGRLDQATTLPYEEWWVPTEGFGGFDAYSIISFSHTDKVLLECPIYGNAAYVIDAEVEVWREMTKQELADSGLAEKIPHRGDDWPTKVRQALELE